MRRLRHQLDKRRLIRATDALKVAEQEIKVLRAQLQISSSSAPDRTDGA